jgi:hypothetical protein
MMQTYGAIGEDALPDKARRRFLTAGALLVGFAFARPLRAFEREPDLAAIGALDAAATGFDGFVPDGFIRIGVDGRIVLVVPSVEMGQGIATGEAMMIQTARASLAGSHAVNDPQGANLIRVILEGASAPDHAAATAMPSFGAAYTDAEIAAVANYAIAHFGGKQGQVTAKDVADARP